MESIMKKIIGISGSLRTGSYNTLLLQAIKENMPDDFSLEIASIKDVPLYNGDDEQSTGIPKSVAMLKEKIAASDALLISTPEYNHGIPGVLKNALDWLTRPSDDVIRIFKKRKIGIIGASPSRLGTAFAQTAWLPILGYLNTHTYFGNQIFVSSAHTLFDKEGRLTDETTKKLLKEYIAGFCDFINGK